MCPWGASRHRIIHVCLGKCPLKRLLWWHFFIISQLEVKRQKRCVRGGVTKRQRFQANPRCRLYFVNTFTSWASVSCLFVSILGGIISCLVMNNRLSYSVFKPNYTFSISRGDYWTRFCWNSPYLLFCWDTFLARQSTFDIYRLQPVWSDFIDPHWSFHVGHLLECVYFDQWG